MANNNATCQVTGLPELSRFVNTVKQSFDGAPLNKLLRAAATPIRDQAKRNARRGSTGLVQQNVVLVNGKKATRYGAAVVVRAKWKGTGAVFEEWGTKDRQPPWGANVKSGKFGALRMKVNAGKLGGLIAGKVTKAGKFSKGAAMAFGSALFFTRVKGMKGTRFFENAVEQKMGDSQKIMEEGVADLFQAAKR